MSKSQQRSLLVNEQSRALSKLVLAALLRQRAYFTANWSSDRTISILDSEQLLTIEL
ncbi:hypothetical protein H6F74_04800 [Trichocoleus sp. FACHB-90]|uniref:hypothetical protein n=1 Tax=Cyanophyceae TaxID=3028117 RepID=UPI001686467B|nr:hypothetical protein [Trichocoleus sp. FACHB-90]MBD1925604.1 hypothetical protein [Trichocoleus sp. FACHB-90]